MLPSVPLLPLPRVTVSCFVLSSETSVAVLSPCSLASCFTERLRRVVSTRSFTRGPPASLWPRALVCVDELGGFRGTCLATSHLSGHSSVSGPVPQCLVLGPFPLTLWHTARNLLVCPRQRPLHSLLLRISQPPASRVSNVVSWISLNASGPARSHSVSPLRSGPAPTVLPSPVPSYLNPNQISHKALHHWLPLSFCFPLLSTLLTRLQPHTSPFWPVNVPDTLSPQSFCTSVPSAWNAVSPVAPLAGPLPRSGLSSEFLSE